MWIWSSQRKCWYAHQHVHRWLSIQQWCLLTRHWVFQSHHWPQWSSTWTFAKTMFWSFSNSFLGCAPNLNFNTCGSKTTHGHVSTRIESKQNSNELCYGGSITVGRIPQWSSSGHTLVAKTTSPMKRIFRLCSQIAQQTTASGKRIKKTWWNIALLQLFVPGHLFGNLGFITLLLRSSNQQTQSIQSIVTKQLRLSIAFTLTSGTSSRQHCTRTSWLCQGS